MKVKNWFSMQTQHLGGSNHKWWLCAPSTIRICKRRAQHFIIRVKVRVKHGQGLKAILLLVHRNWNDHPLPCHMTLRSVAASLPHLCPWVILMLYLCVYLLHLVLPHTTLHPHFWCVADTQVAGSSVLCGMSPWPGAIWPLRPSWWGWLRKTQ